MKNLLLLFVAALVACNMPSEKQTSLPLTGTWELISATSTEKDSTFSTFEPRNKMIKIITPTHFAFFNHDQKMGRDSTTAAFSGGGGTYTLKDSTYTEHLEYFNYREWEGHTFEFVVTIKNDTLTQRGVEKLENLGIDRIIVEKYKRL
ncbi:MAG TPA: hypothetical protein PLO67_10410 [Saprospiraceae bacterium]|mgnify:FL=1|nr:hypothetical protein [Saprospiraceae bacterium]HPI06385.1 hypothetical protein [Saprospiraceae bacterium]